MNEYEEELNELRLKLERLREAEAAPEIIEEHDCELRNLRAIYVAAQTTFAVGADDIEVQTALSELGFGNWTLDHVYSFVYDAAMDADLEGEELATIVNRTDYAASLRAAAQ